MTSDPITSWQTEGEKVEAVTDFLFSGSKIIVDGDCSHEIKRHLLLGRKDVAVHQVAKSRTRPSDYHSHPYMTAGKIIVLTRCTFVGKVVCLLFNMLSRLSIAFLPMSKCLLISWLQSPSAVFLEAPQNKVSLCFHCFPIYLP